jgi:hypothetical protein
MRLLHGSWNLGTGLVIGFGAALATPIILPVVATAARSLFKAGVKSGIILYEKGRMVTEEARESLEDMTAEAKSEMKTGKSKAKTSKAAA